MAHPLEHLYLREIFEGLDAGILIADDNAFYVDVNRKACELFGRNRSDLVGHHLSEFIEGARVADVNMQWKAFLRDGEQSGSFSIVLPDGSPRMFEFHARANLAPGLHWSFITSATNAIDAPGQPAEAGETIAMCAWTKRVRINGRWLPIEDYLMQSHGVTITHGICPEASRLFGAGELAGDAQGNRLIRSET